MQMGMGAGTGYYLHHLGIMQLLVQWNDISICLGCHAVVSHLGVDMVSEIQGCGAGRQLYNLSGRGEYKDYIPEYVLLKVVQELGVVHIEAVPVLEPVDESYLPWLEVPCHLPRLI